MSQRTIPGDYSPTANDRGLPSPRGADVVRRRLKTERYVVMMRQRSTGKEVVPKRTQSACPRCGAWSSAERCPQCGAHKLSTEFSQVRIEDRPKTATAGR